jgi:hypothetical protein
MSLAPSDEVTYQRASRCGLSALTGRNRKSFNDALLSGLDHMSGPVETRFKSLSLQLARLVPRFLVADKPDSADLSLLRSLVNEVASVLKVDVTARETFDDLAHLNFGRKIAALVGDLADAAEKIDHLEEFSGIAKKAVRQLLSVVEGDKFVQGPTATTLT